MGSRWPPALLPAGAFLTASLLAPRLTAAPPALALVALAACGLGLRSPAGLATASFAAGVLRSEVTWVAPLRASRGFHLDRPVEAWFTPEDDWERRDDGDWAARGVLRRIEQSGQVETLELEVRAVVSSAQAPPAAAAYRLRGALRPPLSFYNPDPIWTGGWQLRVKSARFVDPLEPAPPLGAARRARARLIAALGGDDRGAAGTVAGGRDPVAGRRRAVAGRRGAGAAFLEGLLLGRTTALPEEWQRGLRRTGLMHLFAVSGLHVSLIAGLVWSIARTARPPVRAGAALAVAGAYALLVGLGPSVLRSMLMLVAMIGARVMKRPTSSLNALALSAGALAAQSPRLVYDLSFQLTVAATGGVVGVAPILARRWGGGPLATALAVCVGAQLATMPFTVPAFSLIPLAGAALNLIAVPWTGACLALGLSWAVVALIDPRAGAALVPWFDPLARPFGWLAALPPHSIVSLPVAAGALVATLAALAALAAILTAQRAPKATLVIVAAITLVATGATRDRREIEVVMLDVGQGDAILLRDGVAALLVDGGGWPAGDFGGRVLLPALARLGVRSLDAVAVSHPDADHCSGLADLVSYLPVEELWIAPGWGGDPCLRRLLARSAVKLRLRWQGDVVAWRRFRFEVLHPAAGGEGAGNDRSLVLQTSAGGRSLLLTGDVSERVETALVHRRVLRAVDALKVAHHGSGTSTSLPFIASIAPRWALISAGRHNGYGHPAEAVLRRLARREVVVLRTDQHGRIRLRWRPGGPLRVSTARTPLAGPTSRTPIRPGPPWLVLDSR